MNHVQERSNLSNSSAIVEKTVCPYEPISGNLSVEVHENEEEQVRYAWDEKSKGQILGAYYIGYTIMQIPGAWAGQKYGHVKTLTISFFATGLLTSLIPYVIQQLEDALAVKFFIFVRVLIGFLQGCIYPVFMGLWGSWAPSRELSRLVSIQFAGAGIGMAVTYPIDGWLAKELGWQSIFYFTGAVSMLFAVALGYFCFDTPAEHKTISKEELTLITSERNGMKNERQTIPWASIMTSIPVWAIILAHGAGNYGIFVMSSYMPSYLHEQIHFNIESAAILSE